MTREEMHKLLASRAGAAPIWDLYLAAITGICANPTPFRPPEIIEMALDVCIADLAASPAQQERPGE